MCFITLLTESHNDRHLPLLWHILLIPNRINKFMDMSKFFYPLINEFC